MVLRRPPVEVTGLKGKFQMMNIIAALILVGFAVWYLEVYKKEDHRPLLTQDISNTCQAMAYLQIGHEIESYKNCVKPYRLK
jgi:hypothetical protein